MNLKLDSLTIQFKRSVEEIPFAQFNYFFGQMGAGKSSIVRLIDYCFGGSLEMTPALQQEFVAVSLKLTTPTSTATLKRSAHSNRMEATWNDGAEIMHGNIPLDAEESPIIPDSEVFNLSDFLFHLSGLPAPKVRRSKLREESELVRLSFRDMFWYCYLDQNDMDSDFFHLSLDGDPFKRQKSRDAIRYVLGIHHQRVSELETELDKVRSLRTQQLNAARALQEGLKDSGIASLEEIQKAEATAKTQISELDRGLKTIRQDAQKTTKTGADTLRERARNLSFEVEGTLGAILDVEKSLSTNKSLRNELFALSVKVNRSIYAREILGKVDFSECPRCSQKLTGTVEHNRCALCGQVETVLQDDVSASSDSDIRARISELDEFIGRQVRQAGALRAALEKLQIEKNAVEIDLNRALTDYDSAYMSAIIENERNRATLLEKIAELDTLRKLPAKVEQMIKGADTLEVREKEIRRSLTAARENAEKDLKNLGLLRSLFLDCLIKAKIPGFTPQDVVDIPPRDFLPEVTTPEFGDVIHTAFSNLGSGGKKTLFKCCFAVALHRLARRIGAPLPALLIIDSPMKNTSERTNRKQFEGFHQMLYELATSELRGTQFVLVDKEFCGPRDGVSLDLRSREMNPDDDKHPPLIRYYRGP